MKHSNSANRLDRLPISKFHKQILFAVAIAYFFEFADINIFSSVVPKLIKVWHVTVNQVAYVTSTSFLGMFIGSAIGGAIADRVGRKKALTITTVWFSVFSLANAFAWDLWSMGVLRVITSAGLSAMTVVAVIYINEIYPAKLRGKYLAYAMVVGICGTPATMFVSSFLVPINAWTWRLVFIWGGLGIIYLVLSKHLVESPRWFESRGEYNKADAILKQLEEAARVEHGELPEPAAIQAAVKENKPSMSALFQSKYLGRTLLLTVLWVTQTIGFFGYSSWAPTLLAKEGISVEKSIFYVALTTVGAPLGSYLAAVFTERFERKWCLVAFGSIIGLAGLLYGLTFNPVTIVIFGFIVNLFERGYTSFAYAYSPELFDTSVRSMGTSISYGLGRLSNAFGPLIIAAIYTGHGYKSVFYFIAGTWFVGAAALAIFGPKTMVKSNKVAKSTIA